MEKTNTIEPVSNTKKWTVFILAATGIFMSTLDGSIVNVALPRIMAEFQAPLNVIEWVMLIYFFIVSSLLLSCGRLSDIKGRRWVYVRGLLVFTAGSFFCGTAQGIFWLIGARAFQGVGAAMVMASTPALISDIFPSAERGKALGMVGMIVAGGLTVGPALGGWILEYLSWHYIFMLNIPLGLTAAAAVSFYLKGTEADTERPENFDWIGAVLLVIGIGCFIFGVTRSHTSLKFMTVLMLISASAFAGLIYFEKKRPDPILDLSLLKIKLFTYPLISGLTLFTALFIMVFLMPFYLIYPLGFSMKQTGYVMITPFLCLIALSPIAGVLSDYIGSRILCSAGMLILALALFLLAGLSDQASMGSIILRLMLAGIGTAIFTPPNSSVVLTAVPVNRRGIAAGTLAMVRNLGMVSGIALAGAIFNLVFHSLSDGKPLSQYNADLSFAFMAAFGKAMMTGAFIAAIGSGVSLLRGYEQKRR